MKLKPSPWWGRSTVNFLLKFLCDRKRISTWTPHHHYGGEAPHLLNSGNSTRGYVWIHFMRGIRTRSLQLEEQGRIITIEYQVTFVENKYINLIIAKSMIARVAHL